MHLQSPPSTVGRGNRGQHSLGFGSRFARPTAVGKSAPVGLRSVGAASFWLVPVFGMPVQVRFSSPRRFEEAPFCCRRFRRAVRGNIRLPD